MIISARYSNAGRLAGEVLSSTGLSIIPLEGPDISGGLREVYLFWAQSNETAAYVAPVVRRSVSIISPHLDLMRLHSSTFSTRRRNSLRREFRFRRNAPRLAHGSMRHKLPALLARLFLTHPTPFPSFSRKLPYSYSHDYRKLPHHYY